MPPLMSFESSVLVKMRDLEKKGGGGVYNGVESEGENHKCD